LLLAHERPDFIAFDMPQGQPLNPFVHQGAAMLAGPNQLAKHGRDVGSH
jgi:hypothetical protein